MKPRKIRVGSRLRVLHGLLDPRGNTVDTNPFGELLVGSLPSNIESSFFTWRRAFINRYDVLHLHWPEYLVRSSNRIKATLKCFVMIALILRSRMLGVRIVRTVHNLAPHETGTKLEVWVLARLNRATAYWITLNRHTRVAIDRPHVVIKHGHYRDVHQPDSNARPAPGRLLTFGQVRPYKGINDLLEAFSATSDSTLSLRVCGMLEGGADAISLRQRASRDHRVSLDLRFLPDDELTNEISAAELIVLPYTQIHNSGAALLALSLNRPVLMRYTDATADLAREFGPEWVILFEGKLTEESLMSALRTARASCGAVVDLSSRDWRTIGADTARVYREAVRRA